MLDERRSPRRDGYRVDEGHTGEIAFFEDMRSQRGRAAEVMRDDDWRVSPQQSSSAAGMTQRIMTTLPASSDASVW